MVSQAVLVAELGALVTVNLRKLLFETYRFRNNNNHRSALHNRSSPTDDAGIIVVPRVYRS